MSEEPLVSTSCHQDKCNFHSGSACGRGTVGKEGIVEGEYKPNLANETIITAVFLNQT